MGRTAEEYQPTNAAGIVAGVLGGLAILWGARGVVAGFHLFNMSFLGDRNLLYPIVGLLIAARGYLIARRACQSSEKIALAGLAVNGVAFVLGVINFAVQVFPR